MIINYEVLLSQSLHSVIANTPMLRVFSYGLFRISQLILLKYLVWKSIKVRQSCTFWTLKILTWDLMRGVLTDDRRYRGGGGCCGVEGIGGVSSWVLSVCPSVSPASDTALRPLDGIRRHAGVPDVLLVPVNNTYFYGIGTPS